MNCSGIHTHVVQSQEPEEVTACDVLSTEHHPAVLFDTSDLWIAVSLEASSVPLKARKYWRFRLEAFFKLSVASTFTLMRCSFNHTTGFSLSPEPDRQCAPTLTYKCGIEIDSDEPLGCSDFPWELQRSLASPR